MTDEPPRQVSEAPIPGSTQKEPVNTDQIEFPLYAAMKLHVYKMLRQTLQRSAGLGTKPNPDAWFLLFSTRRVRGMVSPKTKKIQHSTGRYTDFVEVSPYFIRERLISLNGGTFLSRRKKLLGGSTEFRWTEEPDSSTMHSFVELQNLLGERLYLAVDLHRLSEEFGDSPFSFDEYLKLFHAHRRRALSRHWRDLAAATPSKSSRFSEFLRFRFNELVAEGFVEKADGRIRLSPKGLAAAHWFELFVYSVKL